MCGITSFSLFLLVAQAHLHQPGTDEMSSSQDSAEEAVAKLLSRGREALPPPRSGLDDTAYGKPSHIAIQSSGVASRASSGSRLLPRREPQPVRHMVAQVPVLSGAQWQAKARVDTAVRGSSHRIVAARASGDAEVVAQEVTPEESESASSSAPGYECAKTLLVLLDKNPYLSPGSQYAVKTAAKIAESLKSKLTIALIDEADWTADFEVRAKTIAFYMEGYDPDKREVLELKMKEDDKGTTVVADMADDMEANMVVLATDVVHNKLVDVNLLSEFIACPFLVVPDGA
eukprot:gnl/TRDRNA2_/TRDRNA2_169784_c2_seq1.p1 gnl/TRDRNA2_/TRDRNA2_169784_c2~~gnl/TRDRNA2_/TRDRNA2_169784_c2_seq1.p1  ORF type:complete len:288 (-),score=50.94 gnl/TRDRNA2_/TRDRNA2_169784_c2_seq1:398-1261(-)